MSGSTRDLTRRAVLLAVIAGGLVRLSATDAYLAYVKPGMRIPLLISVAVLGVLALASASAADRDEPEEHGVDGGREHAHDGHEHVVLPRIGWWLLVPVVCIALVPLNPLGADAVRDRRANEVSSRRPTSPPVEGASTSAVAGGELTMLDFVSRVVNDPANPFTEAVTLVGFVTEDPAVVDGFVLGRFVMSCCAADAAPLLVRIVWDDDPPPRDSWVEVTGQHVPAPADLPDAERIETVNLVVEADEVAEIPQPTEPYETY